MYSDDFDSHVDTLRKVFQKTVPKSRWKNANYFKSRSIIKSTVMDRGYGIYTSTIKEVADLTNNAPSNVGQLRRALELLGFYRRYL